MLGHSLRCLDYKLRRRRICLAFRNFLRAGCAGTGDLMRFEELHAGKCYTWLCVFIHVSIISRFYFWRRGKYNGSRMSASAWETVFQIACYKRGKVRERGKEGGLIWKWMFIDKLSEWERSSGCQADNPRGTSLAVDALTRALLRPVASCRPPKHTPIYHQDKCKFSPRRRQPVTPTRRSPRKWCHYWALARLPQWALAAGAPGFFVFFAFPYHHYRPPHSTCTPSCM